MTYVPVMVYSSLCAEIAPDIFYMSDDGLAYVRSVGDSGLVPGTTEPRHKMGGESGLVKVPDSLLEDVIESAAECPG